MADNYTALKSAQKKRYISKETFNSLDLSQIPVGSEYEVVSPIEKGDLSADINNALNKAEKSISEPTNQTTGSDGDVLVKKGGGSEWSSNVAKLDGSNTFTGGNTFTDGLTIKSSVDENIKMYFSESGDGWTLDVENTDNGNGYLFSVGAKDSPAAVVRLADLPSFSVEVWQ